MARINVAGALEQDRRFVAKNETTETSALWQLWKPTIRELERLVERYTRDNCVNGGMNAIITRSGLVAARVAIFTWAHDHAQRPDKDALYIFLVTSRHVLKNMKELAPRKEQDAFRQSLGPLSAQAQRLFDQGKLTYAKLLELHPGAYLVSL